MYRVDKRAHRHKKIRNLSWVVFGFVLLGVLVFGLLHLSFTPEQEIKNSPPVSTSYATHANAKIDVEKKIFHMQLPAGWKERTVTSGVAIPDYSFYSPSADAQQLDIFVTTLPTTMALNKAIVVSAQGDGVAYSAVSDNCSTFTDSSKADPRTKIIPARWQGIDFLCDTGNYARALVGIVSTEGINQVTLTGPETGAHKLFITYTDNSISPSYTTFYDILGSLRMK